MCSRPPKQLEWVLYKARNPKEGVMRFFVFGEDKGNANLPYLFIAVVKIECINLSTHMI